MKIIWRLVPEISGATNRIFCHFGPFSDLWLSWQFNISKFWKNEKKAWRYHDFTLKYHKWRSYDLWFLTYRAVQTFLLPFSAIFCLYPTNNLKNQNFEKTKKCFEISFYTCVPQMTIIWCVSFCRFGLYFALLPHWQPWKSKLWKNKNKSWRYHHFTHVYQSLWLDEVRFLRYGARPTDGQTDAQKEVSATPVPHLKNCTSCQSLEILH